MELNGNLIVLLYILSNNCIYVILFPTKLTSSAEHGYEDL